MSPSLLHGAAYLVLAALVARVLACLGIVRASPVAAVLACAAGALGRCFDVRERGGDDGSERQHESPAFWYAAEEQSSTEAPIVAAIAMLDWARTEREAWACRGMGDLTEDPVQPGDAA